VLAEQERTQAALRFLLNPTVTLVRQPTDAGAAQCSVSETVGLKFRYLRTLAGCSIAAMAKCLGIADGTLSALELGQHVPLRLYLTYLEALDTTWPDFAALTISPEQREMLRSPPHMALRQCPNPACPLFEAPPTTHINLLRDLPAQHLVRFRCTECGRSFTRSYAGALTSKMDQTPTERPDLTWGLKAEDEIERLVAWGKQGEANRWIAQQLGWGQKTVRQYWRALGLETEVHVAQAQRRAQQQAQRRTQLRTRVDAVLPSLLEPDQEVTLRMVARQLGYNPEYLQSDRELMAYVRSVIVPHNAEVRQARYAAIASRVQQLCARLADMPGRVRMAWLLEELGLSWQCLQERYPELAAYAQQAVKERQHQERQARTAEQIMQIDRAASRLIASGSRLTHKAILAEAKLSPHSDKSPALQQRLQHWVGSCPWEH